MNMFNFMNRSDKPNAHKLCGFWLGTQKGHQHFQHKLFGFTQNLQIFGPPRRSLCASFPGKDAKKWPTWTFWGGIFWKKGKDPHPQDKIQHLDFTKDPRPLYYKTPSCAFYHKNVCSKAVFGP